MTSLLPVVEYPMELFYLVSKFDVSSFVVTGDIDFQTSHFADF